MCLKFHSHVEQVLVSRHNNNYNESSLTNFIASVSIEKSLHSTWLTNICKEIFSSASQEGSEERKTEKQEKLLQSFLRYT